jgi:pimeloyl-ACP methyl ester carboxylesterase
VTSQPESRDQIIQLADGRLLGFAVDGDPAGRPVFHFHGWPGSRAQGQRYAAAARIVGVRLISPDRPGYGLSAAQPGRSLIDWAVDMAELADRLEIARFAVLGVSGGGPYALACAVAPQLMERLTRVAVVSSLAPLNAPGVAASLDRRERVTLAAVAHAPWLLSPALRLVAWDTRRDALGALRRAWRTLPPVDRAIVCRPDYERIAVADIRAALRDGGRAAAQEARLLLRPWGFASRDIRLRIDVWHGAEDAVVPPALGRSLASALPNCHARFLPGEGHYLAIPRADEILSLLAASDAGSARGA